MIDGLYGFLIRLGFTDPLHAPLTHMPIGLVFGALIFILVAVIFKKSTLELTARHSAILAFIMVFPTILFGVLDWIHFWGAALSTPIIVKIILASFIIVVLGAGVIFGNRLKLRTIGMTVVYAAAFIAAVGLGWFGSKLVPGTYQTAARLAASSAPAQADPAASTQAGSRLYDGLCSACHPGGANVVAAQLPVKGSKKLADLSGFTAFLRNPTMPDGSAGGMPAFDAAALPDAQIAQLFAFLGAEEKSGWK